jgi:hypothetical protein
MKRLNHPLQFIHCFCSRYPVITYNPTFVTYTPPHGAVVTVKPDTPSFLIATKRLGRITAKSTGYRLVFDVFSMVCKKSRLILCRKIYLVRREKEDCQREKVGISGDS